MATITTPQDAPSSSKHAEFVALFDMFERMKSGTTSTSTTSEDFLGSLPKDLEPVIRNLYSLSLLSPTPSTQRRGRRNTVAAETQDALPPVMEADYRFTFKKMLHELYEVDDWKEKVQSVLQESQSQFKPLAEISMVPKPKDKDSRIEPRVRFDAPPVGRGRRSSVAGRTRSHTVSGVPPNLRSPMSPKTSLPDKFMTSTSDQTSPLGDVRIVKKRCVGRRPSAGGEIKHWVYESAVSSVEKHDTRDSSVESLSRPTASEANKEKKYKGLQDVDGLPRGSRRRVPSMGSEAQLVTSGKKRRSFTTTQVSGMVDVRDVCS